MYLKAVFRDIFDGKAVCITDGSLLCFTEDRCRVAVVVCDLGGEVSLLIRPHYLHALHHKDFDRHQTG